MTILKRNNVNVSGQGKRPIMFAHGFGCDQTMWRDVAPDFERDHKVILFDLTGAGQSDLTAYDFRRYSSLDGHADDIVAITEEMDLADTVLVGHSVSAITAALASVKSPARFAAIVLVSPSPCFLNDDDYRGGFDRADLEEMIEFMEENYLGWAMQTAPAIAGQNTDEPSADKLTQSFCRTDPAIAQHFGRVTFTSDRREDMKSVSVPSLIIQCDNDAIAPVTVGEWMHAAMPGSVLQTVPVTGHCPHMTAPRITIDAIRAFLADQ